MSIQVKGHSTLIDWNFGMNLKIINESLQRRNFVCYWLLVIKNEPLCRGNMLTAWKTIINPMDDFHTRKITSAEAQRAETHSPNLSLA